MSETEFVLPPSREAARSSLPPVRSAVPVIIAFADDWQMDKDGTVRPSFRVWKLDTGLHSIGEAMSGNLPAMFQKIVDRARSRGQTVLPWNAVPATLGRSYLVKYPGFDLDLKSERDGFRFIWEKLRAGSSDVTTDYAVLDQLIAHWQAEGLIPEGPAESFIEKRTRALDIKVSSHRRTDPQLVGYRAKNLARELDAWTKLAEAEPAAPRAALDSIPMEIEAAPASPPAPPAPAASKVPKSAAPPKAKRAPVTPAPTKAVDPLAPDAGAPDVGMVAED